VALVPTLGVTQPGDNHRTLGLPGAPVNRTDDPDRTTITEVFLIGTETVLQLTAFGRVDTYGVGAGTPGGRVLFVASADPLGTNPSQNCRTSSKDEPSHNEGNQQPRPLPVTGILGSQGNEQSAFLDADPVQVCGQNEHADQGHAGDAPECERRPECVEQASRVGRVPDQPIGPAREDALP
jgi:hypothetical protein